MGIREREREVLDFNANCVESPQDRQRDRDRDRQTDGNRDNIPPPPLHANTGIIIFLFESFNYPPPCSLATFSHQIFGFILLRHICIPSALNI